ncbi:hypothetical protein A9995_09645 [Erythrobacter sp. QSSC1-22B]|nr:hypothetical protein A9995_09645 [Erythrobacter sp. QSSC1-22B]
MDAAGKRRSSSARNPIDALIKNITSGDRADYGDAERPRPRAVAKRIDLDGRAAKPIGLTASSTDDLRTHRLPFHAFGHLLDHLGQRQPFGRSRPTQGACRRTNRARLPASCARARLIRVT